MDRVNELSLKLLSITNNGRNEMKEKKLFIITRKKKINYFHFSTRFTFVLEKRCLLVKKKSKNVCLPLELQLQ